MKRWAPQKSLCVASPPVMWTGGGELKDGALVVLRLPTPRNQTPQRPSLAAWRASSTSAARDVYSCGGAAGGWFRKQDTILSR